MFEQYQIASIHFQYAEMHLGCDILINLTLEAEGAIKPLAPSI